MIKKIGLPVLALLFIPFTMASQITDAERKLAGKELTQSMIDLEDTVSDLSDEQLNFKPDETSWSIAQITEHLAISENMFHGMLEQMLQKPAEAGMKSDLTTDELMKIIRDRSTKVKTQAPFEPSGKYGSHEATLEAFRQIRKQHIDYIKTTDDALHKHYQTLPFGTVDAYQAILFMSGHTDRHIAQMQEVIDNVNFPN